MLQTSKKCNITYNLERKKVKNINLRIKPDGSVHVSAHRLVSQAVIDEFVESRAELILRAQARMQKRPVLTQYFTEHEIRSILLDLCKKVYPYYERLGIAFPQIRFRKMVSQWGNCRAKEGLLTFNTALMYAPIECMEYVVLHEFTHFLQQNHSKAFYAELEKVCPDWKMLRKRLKQISIR